jgi:CBS domain-containing protein
MRTIGLLHRSGVAVECARTVRDAAAIMEQAGIGSLAVLDEDRLVGIVTDRDFVRRVLARNLPGDVRVDSVMSAPVVTIDVDSDIDQAFEMFRTHGLRRLPVVDDERFVGMLTIDDLLVMVADQLAALVRPVTAEILVAHRDVPAPAVR